jgi:plastocyanin
MLRLLCVGGACLALALGAGCGDDDEDTGGGGGSTASTQESPAPETTAETTDSATAGDVTIKMKDFAFDPQEVQGEVGQKITWVNEDDAPHNAVQQNGEELKTKTFDKGGSDSVTLDKPGTIEYICTVHPQMKGTIEVSE